MRRPHCCDLWPQLLSDTCDHISSGLFGSCPRTTRTQPEEVTPAAPSPGGAMTRACRWVPSGES